MTDKSVLMTRSVPYSWDELREFAEREPSTAAFRVGPKETPRVAGSLTSTQATPTVATHVATENSPLSSSLTQEEIDRITSKITEEVRKTLFEEIDLVVELALKKTRSHLRCDIEKAIAINVARSVRDAFEAQKGKGN